MISDVKIQWMTVNNIGPDNWMIDFLPEALSPKKKINKKDNFYKYLYILNAYDGFKLKIDLNLETIPAFLI